MEIRVNKSIYTIEDVVHAAFVFTDVAYFYLDENEKEVIIRFELKADEKHKLKEKEIEGELKNELLAQLARKYVRKNTESVRNMIFQRAMASSLILDNNPHISVEKQNEIDIEEVLKDWFDRDETNC